MKRLALGSLAALALAVPIAAQTPAPTQQSQPGTVFRSGASLVALNVTVSDGKRLVPGLEQTDFSVYEDGVLQHLQFFEAHEVPIDLILLIDTSASMADKMEVVHDAAIGFLKTLRDVDRGAVVTFGDNVNIAQQLTSDRAVLEQAVRRAQPHGSTALNNALYVAMKQFARAAQQAGEVRRQAIAVLSDGEDTSSVISFDDVLAMARKSGINIYTICLQNRYSVARAESGRKYFSESDYSMKTLAQETGALSYFPQTVQELKGIYAGISDELSNQYSIGYSPSNWRADGRFRRIVVKINAHPEFHPRARQGYTAESSRTAQSNQSPQR
ncbi:MAG TPA: VWA domain-containing protein [Vicinamibacterales bacterium]|nr:VWA domain-containing protein [Vicinamibacterales bacterium]